MRFMVEGSIKPNQAPVPIAKMGPWDFWTRPDALGLPDDDVAALEAGTATEEQKARARVSASVARNVLITAPPCEPFRRPS